MPRQSNRSQTPVRRRRGGRRLFVVLTVAAVVSVSGSSRPTLAAPATGGLRGFHATNAELERDQEAVLLTLPSATSLRLLAEELGAQPAIAGTASMAASSRRLRTLLEGWGLEVSTHEYEVYLPHARRVTVERIFPSPTNLRLDERELAVDEDSADSHYPAVAGYSGSGDVTAPVVYANYGRAQDFAALAGMGVEVTGKIALVRYGGPFRGIKVRSAVAAGAVAVLLYSDPFDDGFYLGDVYPDGPFRPGSGIQRGTVKTDPPGDPTTPGWPSRVGAARIPPGDELPGVPVVPIGYDAAKEILGYLGGPAVPPTWIGALPIAYRGGGGDLRVRVVVEHDNEPYKRIYNTVGWLRGDRDPDQWVIVGAHRDSWTNGAVDNVSGTVSVLEAARSLATLRELGARPRRSILFAFWDAEEWGLLGSVEWVEEFADQLRTSAVAYINQDGIAGGPFFGAVATPAITRLLFEVADTVADPLVSTSSVYRQWRRRTAVRGHKSPSIELPGGGSDYAGFVGRLGVPAVGFGFSGASGVYHSAYDTSEFMRRFGDPGYRQHQAASTITAAMAWRLANADVIPLDYGDYAAAMTTAISDLDRQLRWRDGSPNPGAAALRAAVARWRFAARDFEVAVGDLVGSQRPPEHDVMRRVNARLLAAGRQLLRPATTDGAPWNLNLALAPDPDDGYRGRLLPGVVDALRRGARGLAGVRLCGLATRIDAAVEELNEATALLVPSAAVRGRFKNAAAC